MANAAKNEIQRLKKKIHLMGRDLKDTALQHQQESTVVKQDLNRYKVEVEEYRQLNESREEQLSTLKNELEETQKNLHEKSAEALAVTKKLQHLQQQHVRLAADTDSRLKMFQKSSRSSTRDYPNANLPVPTLSIDDLKIEPLPFSKEKKKQSVQASSGGTSNLDNIISHANTLAAQAEQRLGHLQSGLNEVRTQLMTASRTKGKKTLRRHRWWYD